LTIALNKSFVLVAFLAAAALTGIFSSTTLAVFAFEGGDQSETNTEQDIKQKNVGSGESTNNNCALNTTYSAAATIACPVTAALN
jgi:hypothetical protein